MGEDEQYGLKAKGDGDALGGGKSKGGTGERGKTWAVRKYSASLAWFSEAQTSAFLLLFRVSLRVSSGRKSGFRGASRCQTLGVSKSLRCQRIFPLYPFQITFYPRPQAP